MLSLDSLAKLTKRSMEICCYNLWNMGKLPLVSFMNGWHEN